MKAILRGIATCLAFHLLASPCSLLAQKRVTLDFGKRAFTTDTLPFGEVFTVVGDVGEKVDAVAIRYGMRAETGDVDEMAGPVIGCHVWFRDLRDGLDGASNVPQKSAAVDFQEPLQANRKYLFDVELYKAAGDGGIHVPPQDPAHPKTDCTALREARAAPAHTVLLTDSFTVRGETPTDYKQRFDNDIGIVRSDRFGYTGFVSDLHYYFTPINKNEDLGDPGLGLRGQLVRRVSLMAGVSLVRLGSRSEVENLFTFGTPMVGVGIRGPLYWPSTKVRSSQFRSFFQPMRLNVGMIWFKQKDANPVASASHTKRDLFVSLTADVSLKTVLGPFQGVFK